VARHAIRKKNLNHALENVACVGLRHAPAIQGGGGENDLDEDKELLQKKATIYAPWTLSSHTVTKT